MLDIPNALLLVDLQNDFLPGGALAVPQGDAVLPIAARLIPRFAEVFCTQDWHPANHQSFASQHAGKAPGELATLGGLPQVVWPDHCVQETPGAAFASSLDLTRATVVPKGMRREVDSYSGFFDNHATPQHASGDTGLADRLRARKIRHLYVMGLATDYCVRFTVLDALQLGFDVTLLLDGCRGVDLQVGDAAQAVEEMARAGAKMCSDSTRLFQ